MYGLPCLLGLAAFDKTPKILQSCLTVLGLIGELKNLE